MDRSPAVAAVDRRAAMPIVAAWIDHCRARIGADVVNAALAAGMAARREYDAVLAEHGTHAAQQWHRANAHRCTFAASEGGHSIGLPSPHGQQPASAGRADPPIGTPTASSRAGISTPALSLVAGRGEWLKHAQGG